MSRHHMELENALADDLMPPIGRADASVFFVGLKKIAAGPQPDADLAGQAADVALGNEATPQEAEAHTQAGAPDETGHLEGEFAVQLEQVVMTLAQIVSNSMRQHTAYTYYGETMRDVGRGELAELFTSQAKGELKEMRYFLRRMSVLSPGGVPIPVAPTPEPSADVSVALKFLISGEQQAIVLFKTLHAMLGENPMKFTIEQIMTDAQEHLDKLWQYMPATAAPAEPKEQKTASKIAAGLALAKQKIKTAAPNQPTPQAGDVPVGAPGTEPLGEVLGREQLLHQAQLMNENQDLRGKMDQAGQQQVMAQQQIESLGAENEGLQMQAQQSADMAHQATEQAQVSAEQAAAQADAKMRLSIRIQQLRQNLADIVSADPVQEEGVGFGEGQGAGPGTIETSSQQNAAMQEQAAAEQMMADQEAAGSKGGSKAKKETAQAQRAQGEAQQQTQQAAAATTAQ